MASTLKVQNIAHTGGTTAMTIDSSGRVQNPTNPSFFATRDAGTFTTNNGVIVFNNVRHNIGSHYDNTTGVFTAPVNGIYLINFSLISGNTSLVEGEIQVNSNRILNGRNYSAANGTQNAISGSAVLQLSANDAVRILLLGSSSIYGSGGGYYDTFSGHLLA